MYVCVYIYIYKYYIYIYIHIFAGRHLTLLFSFRVCLIAAQTWKVQAVHVSLVVSLRTGYGPLWNSPLKGNVQNAPMKAGKKTWFPVELLLKKIQLIVKMHSFLLARIRTAAFKAYRRSKPWKLEVKTHTLPWLSLVSVKSFQSQC